MTEPPEFRSIIGDDLPPEERARLERVHELLVGAGPPPELPPSLAEAPAADRRSSSRLPRRRLGAALALAAAIAVAAFLGGYMVGSARENFDASRQLPMRGTSAAPSAWAVIKLGKRDSSDNWPMLVTVRGLPPLPARDYYVLYLTRKGKRVSCGSFRVHGGKTATVRFSVPYTLDRSDGWVITRWVRGKHDAEPVLLTT